MENEKIKKQKTSKAEEFNCASFDVFQNTKKIILFPFKNYQWRKNFFQKSSVQWKLINFYVLNCQFWSDCCQIYTGSKHWYNFLIFIVSKTKNIKKHQKTSKIHFFNIFLSSQFFWKNVAKSDHFWLKLYQKCTILLL